MVEAGNLAMAIPSGKTEYDIGQNLVAILYQVSDLLYRRCVVSVLICPGFTDSYGEIMSLEQHEVEKIAHLARIAIDDTDKAALAKELSGILDFVEQMSAVDTKEILPMAHPLHMTQRLREDEVTEPNQRELFQSIAPSEEAGLYLVPKVIE